MLSFEVYLHDKLMTRAGFSQTQSLMFLLLIILSFFLSSALAQPIIHTVTPMDTTIGKYEKFEASIDLSATYTNPYDFDQVEVTGIFTAPDGQQIPVDGFYMEDFILNSSGGLTPDGDGFNIRFSPDQTGVWTHEISVTDATGTHTFVRQQFACIAPADPKNKGYIRTSNSNYLNFDDGDQYIPVGENMAWQNNNAFQDYKKWIDKLSSNKGNYFRLWHAHWGLGIEWKDGWQNFEGLRKYQEENSRYQDWLFDYCAENGVYVMLCLQHHGPVSTTVNPNWSDSPYNVANGGPCQNTWDFFTHQEAIDHTKNRYRYIVARWGYARSIMAWELFNEVDWTDHYFLHRVDIRDWHLEMAAYIKGLDPYGHLVTTSYAKSEYDPGLWANPDIDISQTHHYVNTSNLERVLANGNKEYLADYNKPTLNGEFGLGLSSTLPSVDPNGIHIHNSLWGGLFGGGMGSAMSWWWDIYVEVQDLYNHFEPVSSVAAGIPFLNQKMEPTPAIVTGAPGDLTITPSLGWGTFSDDSITIYPDGSLTPVNPGLGTYLYGTQFNSLYRNAPIFSVTFPQNGVFTIKTSSTTATGPRIAVWVDGNKVFEQGAQINRTYQVTISAGFHTIKVDNIGIDWISISSYSFSGLGSQADVYALASQNKKVAAGWVLNNLYNHEAVQANGPPPSITGAEIEIDGFRDSTYFVKWYDCLTGAIIASDPVVSVNNKLTLPIPELYWDLAFLVDDTDGWVASLDDISHVSHASFQVYPNPAVPGSDVTIDMEGFQPGGMEVSLLDMEGRQIQSYASTYRKSRIRIPSNLTAGFYWVKIKSKDQVGTKPIVVVGR